jgi:hypothetical protein
MAKRPLKMNLMETVPKDGTIIDLRAPNFWVEDEWWVEDPEAPDGGYWLCQAAGYSGPFLGWRQRHKMWVAHG